MEKALAELRIRPGQKFFPRPDEVAEELERGRERLVAKDQQRDGEKFQEYWAKHKDALMEPDEVAWRVERFGYDPYAGKVTK